MNEMSRAPEIMPHQLMFVFDSGYCVTMKNICWEMKQRKTGAKSWFDLGIPGKSSSHFTTVVAACQCIHYTVLVRGVGSTTTLSMYVWLAN